MSTPPTLEHAATGVRVLHANWSAGRLLIWAECAGAAAAAPGAGTSDTQDHPFVLDADELCSVLAGLGAAGAKDAARAVFYAMLPADTAGPMPSERLAHAMGRSLLDEVQDAADPPGLRQIRICAVAIEPADATETLERIEAACAFHGQAPVLLSDSVRFFAAASRVALWLIAQQRVTPMLSQGVDGALRGVWQPWWSDAVSAERVDALLRSVPASVRAAVDVFEHEPWAILEDFLSMVVDALCRRTLVDDGFQDAVQGRDPGADMHVAWLHGLLTPAAEAGLETNAPGTTAKADITSVPVPPDRRGDVFSAVRLWVGRLDERSMDVGWRLCLTVQAPERPADDEDGLWTPPPGESWRIGFHLQAEDVEPGAAPVRVSAEQVWAAATDVLTVDGRQLRDPAESLLRELHRAGRIFREIEAVLADVSPTGIDCTTAQAHTFLRETRLLLQEQGVTVVEPGWWGASVSQLGVLLEIDSGDAPNDRVGAAGDAVSQSFGLHTLVDYRWRVAVGDTVLTAEQFEALAAADAPLIRFGGQWIEITPESLRQAAAFFDGSVGERVSVGQAMRLAFGAETPAGDLPVLGVTAEGWLATALGQEGTVMPTIKAPEGFHGELRPYQERGLSWLRFLEQCGFGACLADDMGLGKTIQVLAMLVHEQREAGERASELGPTLIVAPMSVVGNWRREAERFAPSLRVMVHHGLDRAVGDALQAKIGDHDIVITTYALVHRDFEALSDIRWRRVVLDEAQNVKNASAKQSRAVRELEAPRRMALTGTPVENRLSELWSIMEFCNPGYLGPQGEFRRRFSVPIERRHDQARSEQLRGLVRPFVLRRLKSDPTVIADLPEKVETKEFCHLTPEQASLYERTVDRMLNEIDKADGVRRRGVVLAALIKLKQVCNHPAQALGDSDTAAPGQGSDPRRSGKCVRFLEMLEEVVAEGDKALVFSQFRQMGAMLNSMIASELQENAIFLHGGTSQRAREQMVERFQDPKGPKIFLLSLKAGGVGMNLTAASHVFHFDRWWNPAVENQATDRAYRIGQTRTVHVHKFVVAGTLEERIDQMIDEKTALAEQIVGAGDDWLTELSSNRLREVLTLRSDAVMDTE